MRKTLIKARKKGIIKTRKAKNRFLNKKEGSYGNRKKIFSTKYRRENKLK